MRLYRWHRRFSGRPPAAVLRSWLTEPGSLTTRCQQACDEFRVRVLFEGWARPLSEPTSDSALVPLREVLLSCDGRAVIYAHTNLLTPKSGRLSRWLDGLGGQSLGRLLFAHPGFCREPIEYCRLDARHPLFRRAAGFAPREAFLWARRSVHRLGDEALCVTEVFLPGIRSLEGDA